MSDLLNVMTEPPCTVNFHNIYLVMSLPCSRKRSSHQLTGVVSDLLDVMTEPLCIVNVRNYLVTSRQCFQFHRMRCRTRSTENTTGSDSRVLEQMRQ